MTERLLFGVFLAAEVWGADPAHRERATTLFLLGFVATFRPGTTSYTAAALDNRAVSVPLAFGALADRS